MNELKPGYKTSELYVTGLGVVVSLLVALGVLTQIEADNLLGLLLQLVTVGGALVGIVAQIREYTYGRAAQKMALLDMLKKRGGDDRSA